MKKDTFVCTDNDVNERQVEKQCQYAYKIGIEAFYDQAVYVLEENRKLHARLAEAEDDGAMHSGAVLALEDALKNLGLVKAYFLREPTHEK